MSSKPQPLPASAADEPLPAFEDRAPPDRFCDLILTGGVTSAIAYPGAILALATTYRFNSIGGSSSGAGAAALAAAAEYRRRRGSSAGFRLLIERMRAVEGVTQGRTGLAWLFQPSRGGRRLFAALVPAMAAGEGTPSHWVLSALKAYARVLGLGALAGALLVGVQYALVKPGVCGCCASCAGVLAYFANHAGATALVMLASALAAAWVAFSRDLARMVNADYGLCSGLDKEPGAPRPPLTEWLHGLIQELAGRGTDDPPLTFADLEAAPGSPRETAGDPTQTGSVSIGLQMFTANITHGRPYLLPQQEDEPGAAAPRGKSTETRELDRHGEPRLYFRPAEMCRLFPESVVEHMKKKGGGKVGSDDCGGAAWIVEEPLRLRTNAARAWRALRARGWGGWMRRQRAPAGRTGCKDDQQLYRLPRKDLPIVVAARMSVSFPVLFSAVPLWVLDAGQPAGSDVPAQGSGPPVPPTFRRCLFSDGGLCSNFPIHLFDSPIPAWPTFGVALHDSSRPPPPGAEKPWQMKDAAERRRSVEAAVRPLQTGAGPGPEHWAREREGASPSALLSGVAKQLLATTKDWNDKTLARLPGVRDRIVGIELDPRLGGLNILMNPAQIRYLADLGTEAGRRLLERYARPTGPSGVADGWREHRWVRFNVLRDCLARALTGLSTAAVGARYTTPLREQIREARDEPPLKEDSGSQLLASQAAALEGILATLMQAERDLAAPSAGQPCKPVPRPDLRVRPPL